MSFKSVVVFFDSKNTAWLWNVYRMERICFQKYFTLIFYMILVGYKGFLSKWKLSLKSYKVHKKRICSRLRLFSCRGLCCHSSVWCFDFPLNLKDTLPWHLGALWATQRTLLHKIVEKSKCWFTWDSSWCNGCIANHCYLYQLSLDMS